MNIVKNLFSLTYYTGILTGTQRFRWVLATFLLAILISIQPSIFIFTNVYPAVKDLENKAITLVQEVYPEELEITIKNGVASTNVTEPYYITIRRETLENPFSLQKDYQNTKSRVRLLAIDTKGKAEEFEQYQSLALLTQTSVVYYSDNEIKIYPLRDIQEVTIDKKIILTKIKEFNKNYNISNLLNIFALLSPLLMVIGIFLFQLFIFLLLSIVVYIMVRINQISAGFKNSYRYTAVVALVPIFIWNLASFIPILARNILVAETLLTIIILVISYLGLIRLKQNI